MRPGSHWAAQWRPWARPPPRKDPTASLIEPLSAYSHVAMRYDRILERDRRCDTSRPRPRMGGATRSHQPARLWTVIGIVLLSILPGAQDAEEVICGPAGALRTLRSGTIHIEMSTIDVDCKARLRDAVAARGGDLLDCPIIGSPGMVAPRLATTFA